MTITPSKSQPNTGVVRMEFEWQNDSRTSNKRDEIRPPRSPRLPTPGKVTRICGNLTTSHWLKVRALLDHLVSMGEKRGLRDQLRRKPWPRRSTSWTSITSEAGAILVNAPTLEGWYLLHGQTGAVSCTTGIYALLFGGPSRREGESGEIGVARIECSRTR